MKKLKIGFLVMACGAIGAADPARLGSLSLIAPPLAAQEPGDDAAEEAAEKAAEEAAEAAMEAAEEAAEAAMEAAEEAAEAAMEAAEEAAEAAMEAAEDAAEAAQEAAERAADEAAEEEEAAQDAAEEREEEARDAAELSAETNQEARDAEEEAAEETERDGAGRGEDEDSEEGHDGAVDLVPSVRSLEIGVDEFGDEVVLNERVLLLSSDALEELASRGFSAVEETTLDGLGLVLARVRSAPDQEVIGETARTEEIYVDFNHLYRPHQDAERGEGAMAGVPASFRVTQVAANVDTRAAPKIGLIDTSILTAHTALKRSRIVSADFTGSDARPPSGHGTSIASILVGKDGAFSGLVPDAELYAASVFVEHPSEGVVASASSLVRAIDWMILNDVKTVNMSLAGPPNSIVEAAIRRATKQGVIIVAAAGNNGPASPPRFPAAYANVIAVTAVNRQHRAYPRAVRGPHIDFAGPGVEILAASIEGGYSNVSGTSIAAPFITAAVVLRCAGVSLCEDHDRLVEMLAAFAIDLGLPGRDPVYGNGLIHP